MSQTEPQTEDLSRLSRLLDLFKKAFPLPAGTEKKTPTTRRIPWNVIAELALIGLFALWFGRSYLDFDPFSWPLGREFGLQIQGHHFWNQLKECGLCAFWNGNINGGIPAPVDLVSSTLHPLVFIPTLIWGVIIGVKVAIVLGFWMAGVANWWIARILGVGRVARIWSALLATVGGHLVGRLELGSPGLILSTAATSLMLAAALNLGVKGHRKSTIILALAGALAIASGVGYVQIGLLFWAPAFLFLLLDKDFKFRPVWREYLLAFSLSLLLAGFILVPGLRLWPKLEKFTDPEFQSAQPMGYIPLNLFIRDHQFMRTEILGKFAFEYLYQLYIGWVPILLAILWLRFAPRSDYPLILCLSSGIVLTFFAASAIPFRWLVKIMPDLAGARHTPLIASLAIPAILGLAAYGLDHLMKLDWPQLILRPSPNTPENSLGLSLAWVLVIPLFLSIKSAYDLGQDFLGTVNVKNVYDSIEALSTPDLQWVSPPFGEHYWVEPSVSKGLKITPVIATWRWAGRKQPDARLVAQRGDLPPDVEIVGYIDDAVPIYIHTEQTYAYVTISEQIVPCQATGMGGDLTIECTTDAEGTLIVHENSWSGWKVQRDGKPASLLYGQWLSTEAPAGTHVYHFLYRPWDVPVGLLISLVGIILMIWLRREAT
jgi:hypothetical protein